MLFSCIFQILGNFKHSDPFYLANSYFTIFYTLLTFVLFSYDLLVKNFLNQSLLSSTRFKEVSVNVIPESSYPS